jgi:hypothetical protein
LVGLGLFGRSLDAGAAPILGALFMHLVFGVVLGSTYDLDQGRSRVDDVANANAERSAACGIVLGGLAGYAGGWLIEPSLEGLAGQAMIAFGLGLAGAAVGTLVGSLRGIRVVDDRS